jgi:peptidoglycan-associated lipoprotein
MRLLTILCLFTVLFTGCVRKKDEVWDDTKTCGRHMARGIKSLGGKHGDSRSVRSRDQFLCQSEKLGFIPLPDEELGGEIAMADAVLYRARDPDGSVPGIEAFNDPTRDPKLSSIFARIQFDINSNIVKGRENIAQLNRIADYLKSHPQTWVYVEGHCDERGAEAYNLALGSRRANAVRTFLIKEGVDPEKVYTVSYGKERPFALGHNEDAWLQNRRAEFKIYQQ